MANVKNVLSNARNDVESAERNYIVDCLKSAVSYCKSQYEDSGIDWLPTVDFVGLKDESDKFTLLEEFLKLM